MKIHKTVRDLAIKHKVNVTRDHNGIYIIRGQIAQSAGGAMRILKQIARCAL